MAVNIGKDHVPRLPEEVLEILPRRRGRQARDNHPVLRATKVAGWGPSPARGAAARGAAVAVVVAAAGRGAAVAAAEAAAAAAAAAVAAARHLHAQPRSLELDSICRPTTSHALRRVFMWCVCARLCQRSCSTRA